MSEQTNSGSAEQRRSELRPYHDVEFHHDDASNAQMRAWETTVRRREAELLRSADAAGLGDGDNAWRAAYAPEQWSATLRVEALRSLYDDDVSSGVLVTAPDLDAPDADASYVTFWENIQLEEARHEMLLSGPARDGRPGLDADAMRTRIDLEARVRETEADVMTSPVLASPELQWAERHEPDTWRAYVRAQALEHVATQAATARSESREPLQVTTDLSALLNESRERAGGLGQAPVAGARAATSIDATAARQEALDDDSPPSAGRDLEVSVRDHGDDVPRYVGIDADGGPRRLSEDPAEHAAWLGVSVAAARALGEELRDRAGTEAVWAAPGEVTTARVSDLSDDEFERVINVGPNPSPRSSRRPIVTRTIRSSDAATGGRIDMSQAQAAMQGDTVNRSASSLDSIGVGHPSYGMNTRPITRNRERPPSSNADLLTHTWRHPWHAPRQPSPPAPAHAKPSQRWPPNALNATHASPRVPKPGSKPTTRSPQHSANSPTPKTRKHARSANSPPRTSASTTPPSCSASTLARYAPFANAPKNSPPHLRAPLTTQRATTPPAVPACATQRTRTTRRTPRSAATLPTRPAP
ncbi:hypothetical protein ACX31A_15015 [Dermacoccus nishinomiyaensis]